MVRLLQSLSGDSYTRLLSARVSLASVIVTGFGVCRWDEALGGAVSGWPFLVAVCSLVENSSGILIGVNDGHEMDF